MDYFKKLGNTEFLNCFLAWHYRKFGFFENNVEGDPIINNYKDDFENLFKKFLKNEGEDRIQNFICEEAKSRGLNDKFTIKPYKEMGLVQGIVFSDEVWAWKEYMELNPTYIREINAINNIGGQDINEGLGLQMLDMPVREACKTLNERGYLTYWSSANREDFERRKGDVIQNKSVAYILIDPNNLTDDLKEKLSLNGSCFFWGIALGHRDNGKYYGIWSEITSPDMKCVDLESDLLNKALGLPSLVYEEIVKLK